MAPRKTTKKVTETPVVSETKASKSKRTPVSKNTVQETTATPVVDDVALASEQSLSDVFTEFLAKLQSLSSSIASVKSDFRALEKKATRELKVAHKLNSKRKRKTGNRAPSGFVKPTLISNELANFLGKPTGTEMARTEVTREINSYIRQHNLQDKSNGRKINPDKTLAKLLKIGSEDELTYFNLQRYMSPHFAKSEPKTTAA